MFDTADMVKGLSGVFHVEDNQLNAGRPVFASIQTAKDKAWNGDDVVLLFGEDFQGRDFKFRLSPDAALWLADRLVNTAAQADPFALKEGESKADYVARLLKAVVGKTEIESPPPWQGKHRTKRAHVAKPRKRTPKKMCRTANPIGSSPRAGSRDAGERSEKPKMTHRPSSDHQRNALKLITRRALRRAGGGGSFQHVTRVKEAALSKYAAEHEGDVFMPIDVVLDLDLDIGAPVVLAELAALQGYGLTKITVGDHRPGIEDVAKLARSACDVQVSLSNALADGSVSMNEAIQITNEIDRALEELRCLRARVSKIGESSNRTLSQSQDLNRKAGK